MRLAPLHCAAARVHCAAARVHCAAARVHCAAARVLCAAAILLGVGTLRAEEGSSSVEIDGVAARFFAPEIGGVRNPRFVTERELSFEARLVGRSEGEAVNVLEERHLRAALDRHVAESILAELPTDRKIDPKEVDRWANELQRVLTERIGGEEALNAVMKLDGISQNELRMLMESRARAALYVDRSLLPLFSPSDEQLRATFRAAQHPYKNSRYEDVRSNMLRWFVDDRLRVAELNFLQAARTRISVIWTKATP